jgi:Putative 2OG-Fe(II) oxygenase
LTQKPKHTFNLGKKVSEEIKNETTEPQLQGWTYFPCSAYTIERPDFLEVVQEVSEEKLAEAKEKRNLDPIFPVIMTDNYFADSRLQEFAQYIGQTAWNILQDQGYAMNEFSTSFTEMWTQEHHKHSLMEQHVHGHGSQIVGFYFLEVPENSSNLVFYDPRPGKVQNNLPEANITVASPASNMVHFKPKPGLLVFANSYLPHSFGRHAADAPIKFVHFNLTTNYEPQQTCAVPPAAEVI